MKLDVDHPDYPNLFQPIAKTSFGHICLFSTKGHPEIVGEGIEYEWVVFKQVFRKQNDYIPSNFARNVKSSLDQITTSIAYNTSRRARSYTSAYVNDAGQSHQLIERIREDTQMLL